MTLSLIPTISCSPYLTCSQSARQLAGDARSPGQKYQLLADLHPLKTSSRFCPETDSLIHCELQQGQIAASIHYSVWTSLRSDPRLQNDAAAYESAQVLSETASHLAFAYYHSLQVRTFYRAQGGLSNEIYSNSDSSELLARLLPSEPAVDTPLRLWRAQLRTALAQGDLDHPLEQLLHTPPCESSKHDPAEIERSALAIALVAREKARTASSVSERIGYESVLIRVLEQAWLSTESEASRQRYESVRMLAQIGLRLDSGAPLPFELAGAPGESPEAFRSRSASNPTLLNPVLFPSGDSI